MGKVKTPAPLLSLGFPCGSAGKESACNARDLGSIPGLVRSPGEGKDYLLQCSGLENSMDCIVHRVAKSQTRLSDFHFHFHPPLQKLSCLFVHWCGCCCLITKSCLTLQPLDLQPTRLLCPWDFPGKNTGVGCHLLLQEIFPTQGSNPHLLHCR